MFTQELPTGSGTDRSVTGTTQPFAAGARAITPLVLGAVPFGVAIGAAGAAFVAVRRTGSLVHAFLVGLPAFWLAHVLGLP